MLNYETHAYTDTTYCFSIIKQICMQDLGKFATTVYHEHLQFSLHELILVDVLRLQK